MTHVNVTLSEQDLGDFLEGNQTHMNAYRDELHSRLTVYFGSATVSIDSNALSDTIDIDGESDNGTVAHIMNEMVNDWSWLVE